MKLDIIVANPSGNITIFVMTPVNRDDYVSVAEKLLALPYKAEQVAFVTGEDSFEMAGLEFCGNATRTFALIIAKGREEQCFSITTSGIETPVTTKVDPANSYAASEMPLPLSIKNVSWEDRNININGKLVDFGGILHLVLNNQPASAQLFEDIKDRIMDQMNPPALGVMFCDPDYTSMIPVVYVRDVDSTYFEGSCASGTAAVASILATEGSHTFTIDQPEGSLSSTVTKKGDTILSVTVEGKVDISPMISISI